MHPYESYIEAKAEDYYSRQAHEPQCETRQPYKVPTNPTTGETYDIYIPQHCDCWLSENFDNLTTERKLEALRSLSHRFGLHSPACSQLKRTAISYRNRPEVMTGWCDCWLGIDVPKDQLCPACSKPLFFAPNAPEDSAKKACSDLNCVNAHGITHTAIDRWDTLPVEYNETPEQQEKDHTMSNEPDVNLLTAKVMASQFEEAQTRINNFLAPFVKDYTAFMTEEDARGFDLRDFKADTFIEIEGNTFLLHGEEEYSYGEYYTPTLNLPFDFVANPKAFKADYQKQQAEIKAKADAKKKADKQGMVERLRAQLARAEAELAKADEQNDPIKGFATRNQAKQLRDQLAISGDQG